MLKIVWIVPGFSSNEDDWCIPALLDLARAMAQHCELSIVAMRYPYRRAAYGIAGAKVYSIGGGHRGPAYTPAIWRDTTRAVRKIQCDVVHAFWAYEPGLIAASFSSRVPVIISLAGGELIYLPEIGYGLWGKSWRRSAIRWALGRARVVTAGSPYLMELAQKLLPLPDLRHVPLGVDLKRWVCASRDVLSPTVINVGSLEPVKGQEMLLRAFALVHQSFRSAGLRIAGGGRGLGSLQRLARELGISERVEFVGSIPHEDMPSIYAGASLFAQASWHEAQGMAAIEAAACGLPIVGTAVGALTAFSPEAAINTPVGDAHCLAGAIRQILTDNDRAAEMGRNARKKVEDDYKLDTAVGRFIQLYKSVS